MTHPHADEHTFTCEVCGVYDIPGPTLGMFRTFQWGDPDRRYLLSALAKTAPVRGLGRYKFTTSTFSDAVEGRLRDPSFKEKRDYLLDWIAYKSRNLSQGPYGATVTVKMGTDYPAAWCRDARRNASEWNAIIVPLIDKKLVMSLGSDQFRISDSGWEYLESRPTSTGSQGFIAMAFRDDLKETHQAIHAAIESAGYKPLRIDKHEYIGGVMDEIKARIRDSRFVVADLTYNRGGVYHEAGFALGLNIPVIPTCRLDHVENAPEELKIHFDLAHLNLITWTPGALSMLTSRLKDRIEAVFKHGPVT
jgi:hypothetical protein